MFWVYVLQSIKSGRYYIGHTANLERRVVEHNIGKNIATRNKGPYKVVYFEKFNTRVNAIKRELQIKSFKGGEAFKRLIEG